MIEKIKKESSVIRVLARIVAQYPRDEKILITPSFQIGSQILEELTRSGTSWMNFRPMTMYALARQSAELVSGEVLTEVGMKTILDTVLTQLDQTKKLKYFQKRSINKGMIDHLADTINELKTLGIQPDNLSSKHFVDVRKAADLKYIYTAYQIILNNKNLLDSADIWITALKNSLKQKKRPKAKYIILAGCYANVTQKDFIKALAGADLIVIEEDPVEGLIPPKSIWAHTKDHDFPSPETDIERLRWVFDCEQAPKPFGDDSIELFRAAGSRNEVSEVMRRIAAENLPADQVEIIYTDAHNYVSAIHAFSERVGVPVTFAEGLPSYFSTPGRVLAGILMWIQEDFSEIYLRRLLKSRDLTLGAYGDSVDRADLAYLLRTSGVGWGRDRYDRILKQRAEAARKKSDLAKKENELPAADRKTQEAEGLETLRRICMDLFLFIPDQDDKGQIDFKKLCVGCVDIIQKFVRIRDERDNAFAKAATNIFNMLSRIAEEKMPVTEAIDKLLHVTTRIRYGDSPPRPGHVHVAPYRQGGRSGRPYTFIVGMDELKFPGHGFQDPVLLDTERIAIHSYLATSEEKMRKNLFDMAMLLARVRGRLTMSYSAYDVLDDRVVLPSSVLLQVLRVKDGKPEADYTYLAQVIKDLVCFNVGSHTDKHIDAIGWWLDQLTEKHLLKDGTDALRTCYPGISLGLLAQSERVSDRFTVYDGLVLPEGDELDPRQQKDMIFSASRLEAYAKNPFGFFLEYVLNVERPEETKRDMATWLDSSQRGELLHDVYRRFVDSVKNMKQAADEDKKEKIVFAVLNEVVQEFRETYPPAGEAVFITEVAQLKRDMNVFLRINNQELGIPLFAEMVFGLENIDPVPIKLKDGQVIYIRGMIDRVDKIGKEYAVWDYKTGSASAYEHRAYVVRGRQIQHALYYKAAEYLLQKKDKNARVTVSGYVLPTEKGERFGRGSVFKRSTSRFDECDRALTLILDSISRGVFIKPDKVEPWMKDADIFGDKISVMNVKVKMNNEENTDLAHLRELKRCK